MNNLEVADLLHNVAAAYKIKNEIKNKFKIVAYERAADAIEHLSSEVRDVWDEGNLKEVAGIGPSIADHLDEIFKTGKSKHFSAVLKGIPPSVFELLKVTGIGPKHAFKFAKELKITRGSDAIKKLKKAAMIGKIARLEGFSEDSQKSILAAVKEEEHKPKARLLIDQAEIIAGQIIDWVNKDPNVVRVDALGSLRRKASTVGDIDISASSKDPKITMDHFIKFPNATRVLEKGDRSGSIMLPGNIRADLMVETPDAYGALLQHFTGSKHHNIAIRDMAIKKGWSVSDYGIYIGGKLQKLDTEEKLYKKLGLAYIPPEIREDNGEIIAAKENKIPKLIELDDIKGDLHMHTNFDIETSHDIGANSMEDMALVAQNLGYEYIALTEHNPGASTHNYKQINNIIKSKKEEVDKLNYSFEKYHEKRVFKIFNSLEIDIKTDGSLPVDDSGLELLDFALVSIHSSFRSNKKEMTKRILAALNHPKVKIFAHPTARKLNERGSIDLDWPQIFDFCLKNNKWLEINADPHRLDLPDFLVKDAIEQGVKLVISTDSHHKNSLANMKYGVYVARRGWATKMNIANTRALSDFEKMLN